MREALEDWDRGISIGGRRITNLRYAEVVSNFIFLESLITKDGLSEKEIRRSLAMGRSAMGGLTDIWKYRGITLRTKIMLVKSLVFPIVLYEAESWTMRKLERKIIDAFELWCWRHLLRVTWIDRKTHVWVIDNIKPALTLVSRIVIIMLLWQCYKSMRNGILSNGRNNEGL